jgi:hypothetical protein
MNVDFSKIDCSVAFWFDPRHFKLMMAKIASNRKAAPLRLEQSATEACK